MENRQRTEDVDKKKNVVGLYNLREKKSSGMCEGVCNENDSKIPQNLVKFLDPLTPDASQ